jgi:RNA polymerase sigma-70 factor (ECF subfamily)
MKSTSAVDPTSETTTLHPSLASRAIAVSASAVAQRTSRTASRPALSRLRPEQREAFLLKYVEELGYDEMSRLTGAGVSALKMRVMRACERLRELLSDVRDDREVRVERRRSEVNDAKQS